MPRIARVEIAGAIHHITARTPTGRVFFLDDDDRLAYLGLFEHESRSRNWSVFTYCLMTNHVHLLLRTPAPDLGAGFKRVNQAFAERVNRKYEGQGHVFGSRFDNRPVLDHRHYAGCLRYIARNPVEAGLCGSPREWRWSAHAALAGLRRSPEFLERPEALALLGGDTRAGHSAYAQLTAQSNPTLLATLARSERPDWIVDAVDRYGIPLDDVADFLGKHRSTVYRRLAAARDGRRWGRSVP